MNSKIIPLNGKWLLQGFKNNQGKKLNIISKQYIPLGWYETEVPGSVELAMKKNGVISDTGFSLNETDSYWMEDCEWWFRKEFKLDNIQNAELVFEGLDLLTDIYLNGHLLGYSDNMFLPYRIQVNKKHLKNNNILMLCFKPLKHNVPL